MSRILRTSDEALLTCGSRSSTRCTYSSLASWLNLSDAKVTYLFASFASALHQRDYAGLTVGHNLSSLRSTCKSQSSNSSVSVNDRRAEASLKLMYDLPSSSVFTLAI